MYIHWDRLPERLHCTVLRFYNEGNKNQVFKILRYHNCLQGCVSCTKNELGEWVYYAVQQELLICDK